MAETSTIQGTLIPVGGNEDRGFNEEELYELDFVAEGILSHVVKESGGPSAKIVVLPTASGIPKKVGEAYLKAFAALDCQDVQVLHIRERSQCEDPETLELMRSADCVMFSGGDQSRITDIIGGTSVHSLLQTRYRQEPFVIAGTSAGAMAMTEEMIAGGSATESLIKGAVQMYSGMGWIPGLIIDTHFIRRGRFGRLAEAVAIHPSLLGVGLAEDTGMVIRRGQEFRVIGSGMVIVMDPSNLSHNYHNQLKEGTPMSMSNLVTHILANGDRFTLKNRKVETLPLDAAFI